ncbi:transmembrane protein 268 isoform X1 [Sphaerodactylus townsendi]|uniref:transmembrane protein 268 isoform X1 n=2 Tax=Sphaerodactylus townsendi TaxID=933632 RepID=UPI0020265132|nr:transmembrane protein 268 isoform X1 [Sphaerodactylus townsendi]XP_048369279.1 transmembrane protein 268 isoform X1 [Sphaerodactylus townsendi]XP_048369280.1 transmembrane protein 268 isoform X1 [Sphaerodactylus townsendi]
MAPGKTQAGTDEKEELTFSVSYCRSQAEEHSVHWREELLNGQVLMVLSARKACSPARFDTNLCAARLKSLGIQMTTDQWRNLIQSAVLEPEVRKYMFYNSRVVGIAIAVVFYMTVWINLYSTLQIYSIGQSWKISILVTLGALVGALAIRLIIHQQQGKMNMNTDMRLMAANEVFMKHELLVGVTDQLDQLHSIPQLWFVHFNVEPCLQSLEESIEAMKRNQESALRHNLDELCLVTETAILPAQEEKADSSLEETPLLPDTRNKRRSALTCRELLQLIPDGAPKVMAQQLLMIYSGYYIRLLVSSQLPEAPVRRHVMFTHIPCLCQFIEFAVLRKRCFSFKLR